MEGPSGRHSRAEKDGVPFRGRSLRLGGRPGGANLRATRHLWPQPGRREGPASGPKSGFANGRALGLLEPVRGEQEGRHP